MQKIFTIKIEQIKMAPRHKTIQEKKYQHFGTGNLYFGNFFFFFGGGGESMSSGSICMGGRSA